MSASRRKVFLLKTLWRLTVQIEITEKVYLPVVQNYNIKAVSQLRRRKKDKEVIQTDIIVPYLRISMYRVI
jgi:hypothetical protein